MDIQSLKLMTRSEAGSGEVGRLRNTGFIPAVLYGLAAGPVSIKIDYRTFDDVIHGAQGEHAILQLDIEDKPELSGPALIKEVQHHPVRGHVTHADLMRIDLTKKIHTLVPIQIEGQAAGVVEGGVLDNQTRELEVECLPTEVPEAILADVSALDIGHSLHVSDLEAPEGVEILTSPERTVVAVHAPRVVLEEVEAEEIEGEEGEGLAEGEEPAEGEAAAEKPAEGESSDN